ncbi:MAG: secretin N-terminal domain-containing protein [Pseudomonadota bacterium]
MTTKVMVQADEQTNALIITARPDLYRDIKAVIERLDIRRDQVLVEALIVEVSQDKAADFGVQWVGVQNDLVDDLSLGDSDVSTLAPGTLIGVLRAGEYSFGALAKALDNDADANLLSTPSLLTLDNQEAEIVVARQVPFITGSFTSISEGGSANPENPFQTIERSNVGLTLRITPQINEGDAVRLAVDQEISQILPDAASAIGASDVVTSIRSIKTNVIVEDGATLVLGGLIDDLVRESESRIPFLGDIPIAGELFTFRSVEAEKTNLMIFIRPVILRNAVTNLAATEDRYNDVREMQLERHERGVKLLSESEQPVLQPLDAEGRPIKGPPVLAAPEPAPEPAAQDDFLIHDYDY